MLFERIEEKFLILITINMIFIVCDIMFDIFFHVSIIRDYIIVNPWIHTISLVVEWVMISLWLNNN